MVTPDDFAANVVTILEAVMKFAQFIWGIVKDIVKTIEWVIDKVKKVLGFLKKVFIDPILGVGKKVFKTIEKIVKTVWKTIQAGLERIVIDIRDLVEYMEFGLTPLIIAYKILSATVKKQMIPAIRKGIEAVKNWIPVLVRIGTFVGNVLNVGFSLFYDTLSLLAEPIKFLIGAFDSLVSWIDTAVNYVKTLKDEFINFINEIKTKIGDFFGGMFGGTSQQDSSAFSLNPPNMQNVFKLDLRDAVVDNKESLISEIIEQASMRLGF